MRFRNKVRRHFGTAPGSSHEAGEPGGTFYPHALDGRMSDVGLIERSLASILVDFQGDGGQFVVALSCQPFKPIPCQ